MTFSARVKEELAKSQLKKQHCMLAELSGVLAVGGVFERSAGRAAVAVSSESVRVAQRVCHVANKLGQDVQMISRSGGVRDVYVARIVDRVFELMEITGCMPLNEEIIKSITERDCCKGAFLRGTFLAGGSVTDPAKGHHAEIVIAKNQLCDVIQDIMAQLEISCKYTSRRDGFVLYIKEGEAVSSLLAAMGAHAGMLEYENSLVVKEVRNKINRENNCMTANIDKTVTAAARQRRDIAKIEEKMGFSALSPALREVADARVANPEATLAELAQMLGASRSGINKRLRRLSDIADAL